MTPRALAATRNVRLAAQDLRSALNLPNNERAPRLRDAKEWLLSAADDYAADSAKATELYFSTPTATTNREIPIDALSSILEEAQVGNTLIAAGHAVDETGEGGSTRALDEAISGLQTADFRSQAVAVLNFAGEPTHSPDIAAAAQSLRARTNECLNTFVTEARGAGAQVLTQLSKVDSAKALEALSQLGGPFAKLPQVGVLIKKGIERLQRAMDSLMKLLDAAGLKEIKEKLTALGSKLSHGTLIDSLLQWALGGDSVKAAIDKVLETSKVAVPVLDGASDLLPPLGEGFKVKMGWAKTLTGVIATAAGLLLVVGAVAAAPLAVFTAGAYLLVLAAILLVGRDYAGEGDFFLQHQGLRAIIESLTV
jgi:hypothetical protein